MAFYILQFLFLFVFSFSYSYSKDKYFSIIFKFLSFFIIFIPAAIRYNIGTDYSNYVQIFNNLKFGHEIQQEYGWKFLNLFVISNKLSVQWIFIISSFITYIWLFYTDKKSTWIVLLIYYLYLYTYSFNAVRNAISITLFWYSYMCLLREKKIRGFVFILIGSLFHVSAFLYIPLYFMMCFVPIKRNTTIILGVVFYVLFARLNFAGILLNSFLLKETKFAVYSTHSKYAEEVIISTGLGVTLRLLYTFLLYILCDKAKCKKEESYAISWLFLALIIADSLAIQIFIFRRLLDCFYIAYIAMFYCLLKKSNNVYTQLGKLFCFIYVFVFVFLAGLYRNSNEIIPYMTILRGFF